MSINSKMTALADEVRVLSGTIGALSIDDMTSKINTENTNFTSNISTQDNLIEQIKTALQGKAGGGAEVDHSMEDGLVTGTGTSYTNDRVTSIRNDAFYCHPSVTSVNFPICTSIGTSAFYSCSSLTSVNFPACKNIKTYAFRYCHSLISANFPVSTNVSNMAFYSCTSLTNANFPVCTSVGASAFGSCYSLTSISFPVCISVGSYAFAYCSSLTSVNFPVCNTIEPYAFYGCSKLISLTLGASTVATLTTKAAFTNTPMSNSTYTGSFGSIYVPASLVDAYKSATNWATYASRITAISNTEEDSGNGGDNIITFMIKDEIVPVGGQTITYQAEKGMTWEDWFYSNYNTTNYKIDGSNIVQDQAPLPSASIYYNNVKVNITDVIINDTTYALR